MKFNKIYKIILLLIAIVLLIFFWQVIVNLVVSTNLEVSQGNLFALTIIFWLEILFILVTYDLVIIELYSGVSYCLSKLGQWAIGTNKVSVALYTTRLNYYLLRLSRLLRVGWVTYASDENNSVWIGISKLSLTQLSLNIFRFIISTPMFLAFLSACFSLRLLKVDFAYYSHKLQEFLRGILQIKVNIGDIFSRLPALVALMTILPILFFFYFYSQKRDVRKIIDKENSKYFEEVVLLYEKLLIWIDNHIYELSENFNYVIKCQDSIVEIFLKKEVPNYISLAGKQYYIPGEIETLRFVEVTDLTEFREIMSKLSSDRLRKYTRIFSVKRFDIWYLYFFDFPLLSEEEKIERSLYTKKGLSYKLDNRHTFPYDFTQEQIEKRRKEEQALLSWSIYDKLELLYRFKRVSDSLRKYLYSSRTERLLLKALNKDK
jgi:hypothetical protein